MSHDTKDLLFILASTAAGIILLVGAIVGFVYYASVRSCDAASVQMERDTRFDFWGGCFVQVDSGEYVDIDNFRVNENGEVS